MRVVQSSKENDCEGMTVKSFEWSEVERVISRTISSNFENVEKDAWPGLYECGNAALWRAIPGWVLTMFDACLRDGCFPCEWKKERMVILPKSPKKPQSDLASYRLICCLC